MLAALAGGTRAAAPPAKTASPQVGPEKPGSSVVWSGDYGVLGVVSMYADDYCHLHYGQDHHPKLHLAEFDTTRKRLAFGCHVDTRASPLGELKPAYVSQNHFATEADYAAADADLSWHNDNVARGNDRTAELCRRLLASDDPTKDPEAIAAYFRRGHTDMAALRAKHPKFKKVADDQDWNGQQAQQKLDQTFFRTQCTLTSGQ
jgi:hypothetical protein